MFGPLYANTYQRELSDFGKVLDLIQSGFPEFDHYESS